MSGSSDTDSWSKTFNATGTYLVEAIVYDSDSEYSSPVAWTVSVEPLLRGLYVDGFEDILGDAQSESELLQFAENKGFKYLVLYGLHLVPLDQTLSDFISTAKSQYSVQAVGAAGENSGFFGLIAAFDDQFPNSFDVLNLEFEYWNIPGRPFSEYVAVLQDMCDLAEPRDMLVEAYIGWPTESEAVQIAVLTDRILLHCYVQNPADAYSYARTRLEYLGSGGTAVLINPLFSAENSFMGPWLEDHSMSEAESIWLTSFAAETGTWSDSISVGGFQYFAYSHLEFMVPVFLSFFELQPGTATVTASWQIAHSSEQAFFRLVGSNGDVEWEVPHSQDGHGTYVAEDHSVHLNLVGQVTYRLYMSTGDCAWFLLTESMVTLESPVPMTRLLAPRPNPFNPRTTISFECREPGNVRLAVYDLSGRQVATIVDEWLELGRHDRGWDGRDDSGRLLAAGQYLVRLETKNKIEVQKVIMVK